MNKNLFTIFCPLLSARGCMSFKIRVPSLAKVLMLVAATSLVSACAGGGASIPISRSSHSALLRLVGVRQSAGVRVTTVLLTSPTSGKAATLTMTERYSQIGDKNITDTTVQDPRKTLVTQHIVEDRSAKTTSIDTVDVVSGQTNHQSFNSLISAVPNASVSSLVSQISATHSGDSATSTGRRPQLPYAICIAGCLPLAETLAFYALCVATCAALSEN